MSGQFRTFKACFPSQRWQVLRHFDDLHFYLVMQRAPDAEDCLGVLREVYGPDRVTARLIDDPRDLPAIAEQLGRHAPADNFVPYSQLLMQHWYQNEVYKLYAAAGRPADTHIRLRADLHFVSFNADFDLAADTVLSPYWGRFGGINDRFAVMSGRAADHYFTVYDALPRLLEMGCPFHPESLLKGSLELGDIRSIDTLQTEFTTVRPGGQHRHPEIAPSDIVNLVLAQTSQQIAHR